MSPRLYRPLVPVMLLASAASAQMHMRHPTPQTAASPSSEQMQMDPHMPMPGMNMDSMQRMQHPATLIDQELNRDTSGTSAEPLSTPAPMLMSQHASWTLMLHGLAFLTDTQQSGPRGADKFFSTNWIMPMAQRRVGPGQLTVRTMLSAEPTTISHGFFPELFQQGETAGARPIVDGQHPHDFVMELAAMYDVRAGEHTLISFYAAPVGDPAIGPTAYPHRWSASENSIAALGHHQEDSTHIAFNVLTGGLTWRNSRVEVSGFHGAEPDEARWSFQPSPNGHAVDSWSTRLTVNAGRDWSGQYSFAHITSPEMLHPGEDQARHTASMMYNHSLARDSDAPEDHNISATALWGRTESLTDHSKENSYLLEGLYNFSGNALWTRMENAGRSNELLSPMLQTELPLAHVAAYTFGYDRNLFRRAHLSPALGAQFTTYSTPSALLHQYGSHPFGVQIFLRLRVTGR